jgi:hypothetical protein
MGFPKGGSVPESGLALWVAKPLGGNPDPLEAGIILPEREEFQWCPKEQK